MGHVLNILSPYTQTLLIIGIFCYAVTQFCLDLDRRRWKRKFREQTARRETAEAGNKAKAFFLTTMSHEVRAPLDAIVGFTELAMKTPLNPELREYLGTVRVSADWLGHVVKEIQDYSRIEAGMFHLCIDRFSIGEIARSAVNIARPMADKTKLMLRLHLDGGLPSRVQGDGARLLQVLFNLIENAVQYTTAGSVLVTVVLENKGLDEATVRLSVADTGCGIAPERLPSLFEPLSSPSTRLDRRARTCGFGLPICQRIVQMMGSEIEVKSRPGVGSTFGFSLTLPVFQEKTALESAPIQDDLATPKLNILLADDEVSRRRSTLSLLQRAGHKVTEAATGRQALTFFTAGNFELVLLNLELPDMSGVEATQAIRAAEPEGYAVPIYALSLPASESARKHCLHSGIAGFVELPSGQEALLKLIDRVAVPPPCLEDSSVQKPFRLLSTEAV